VAISDLDQTYNPRSALTQIAQLFDIPLEEVQAIMPQTEVDFKPDVNMVGESRQLNQSNLSKLDKLTPDYFDAKAF
jgi:hypothetical protein